MDAATLVERVAAAYATARYYTDRGRWVLEAAAVPDTPLIAATATVIFETAFQRPDVLLFKFTLDRPRVDRRIEANGDRIRIGDAEGHRGFAQSLDSAMHAMAGCSGSTSCAIPKLLLPTRITGATLLESTTPPTIRETEIDNALHWHLCTSTVTLRRYLAIDKTTFAIRRVIEQSPHSTSWTDYRPLLTP